MPELTDVEVARRHLEDWLKGAAVAGAEASDRRIVGSPSGFRKTLVGKRVLAVRRRGKWLRIELEDGNRLFSHLGMTGDWVRRKQDDSSERLERARIDVVGPNGRRRSIRYVDARRFGRLIAAGEDIPEWKELGADPLLDGVDGQRLEEVLRSKRRAVKSVLMDQTVLAGIGNMLATEILWHARLDPRTRSDTLEPRDIARLTNALGTVIRKDLREATAGSPPERRFAAYGRAGKPCPRCGTRLESVTLEGRTTTFCPRCQRVRAPARGGRRSPSKHPCSVDFTERLQR